MTSAPGGEPPVLFEEKVRPPLWYYVTMAVGLSGVVLITLGWGPPWPVLVVIFGAASVAAVPNVLHGPNWTVLFPLRLSLTRETLRFGYFSAGMLASLPSGWSLNSRAMGRVSLRFEEIEGYEARTSIRGMFLPKGSWLALFWGFQVPYIPTGIELRTRRGRYWVSTRRPQELCDALRQASRPAAATPGRPGA